MISSWCSSTSTTNCQTKSLGTSSGTKFDYPKLWAAGELAARKASLGCARMAVLRDRLKCGIADPNLGFSGFAMIVLGYLGEDPSARTFIQGKIDAGGNLGTIAKAALLLFGNSADSTKYLADVKAGTSSSNQFVSGACAAALGIVNRDDATINSVLIPKAQWIEPDTDDNGQAIYASHLIALVAWDRRGFAANADDKGAVTFIEGGTPTPFVPGDSCPGSTTGTGGTVAATGGTVAATGGAVVVTGGTVAVTGGAVAVSGGTVARTGGTVATAGGSVAGTGGSLNLSGGTIVVAGGAAVVTGGTVALSGGIVARSGGTTTATGGAMSRVGGTVGATGGVFANSGGSVVLAGGAVTQPGGSIPVQGGQITPQGGNAASTGGNVATSTGTGTSTGTKPSVTTGKSDSGCKYSVGRGTYNQRSAAGLVGFVGLLLVVVRRRRHR